MPDDLGGSTGSPRSRGGTSMVCLWMTGWVCANRQFSNCMTMSRFLWQPSCANDFSGTGLMKSSSNDDDVPATR